MAKKTDPKINSGDPAKKAAALENQARQQVSRREMLKQRQIAEQRRARNVRIGLVALAIVIFIAVIAVVVFALQNRKPAQSAELLTSKPGEWTSGQVLPPNANSDQTGIVDPRGTKKDAPYQLTIYMDYQCPWCSISEKYLNDALGDLLASGEISVTYRVKTDLNMLAGLKIPESSTKAAKAATCADMVGKFAKYHDEMMKNQPEEGDGYPDSLLLETYPKAAGITGDDLSKFTKCYQDGQTSQFVTRMAKEAEHINATPRYEINGKEWKWSELVIDAANGTLRADKPTAAQVLESIKANA